MLTLAYDVTAGRAAVGLFDGDVCLDEQAEAMTRGHSERLFPMIEAALAATGRTWGEIDLIAVCTGPGNFTGARIGVAAARGLSLSTRAPAIGVDRFEALAEGHRGAVCVALAAPGGMVHAARLEGGTLIGDAATLSPEEAAPLAVGTFLIGDGAASVAAAIHAGGGTAPRLGPETGDAPLAALAAIARRAGADAPRPVPRYLRPVAAALPRQAPPPILP